MEAMADKDEKTLVAENLSASMTMLEEDIPKGWFLTVIATKADGRQLVDGLVITNGSAKQMISSLKATVKNFEEKA